MSKVLNIDSMSVHISEMEQKIENNCCRDLVLDFNKCNSLKSDGMIRLCSFVQYHQQNDIVFEVNVSKNLKIKRELINNNWANLIESSYPISSFRGFLYTPVMAFKTPDEQNETVNRILEVLISAYPELERSSFATIEWSLNEIMDNVIVHSESKTGGLVQLKVHRNKGKEIEIVVSDSGVGIVESLKNVYKNRGKMEILFESINEGVTNGKGQGNGLFGTSEVCRVTMVSFLSILAT